MDYTRDYIIEKIDINNIIYDIFIGKNASGNETIIKLSHPESIWFHLDSISSSHIILDSKGDHIPKRYINQVASMLFNYKNNIPKHINVIYCLIKYVKLTNTPGTVTTKHTKVIKF